MTENGTDPPSRFASTLHESVPTETVGLTTSTKRCRLLTKVADTQLKGTTTTTENRCEGVVLGAETEILSETTLPRGLPPEVWARVFSYLTPAHLIRHVIPVCRLFRNLAYEFGFGPKFNVGQAWGTRRFSREFLDLTSLRQFIFQ